MNADAMLACVSPSQLTELLAFEQVEPGGALRDDLRMAMICIRTVTAFLKKKDGTAFSLQDFMLDFDAKKPDHTDLSRRLRNALAPLSVVRGKPRKK